MENIVRQDGISRSSLGRQHVRDTPTHIYFFCNLDVQGNKARQQVRNSTSSSHLQEGQHDVDSRSSTRLWSLSSESIMVTIPVRPFWSLSLTHVPENASTGHRAIKVVNQAPHTHVLQLQRASVATKTIPPLPSLPSEHQKSRLTSPAATKSTLSSFSSPSTRPATCTEA